MKVRSHTTVGEVAVQGSSRNLTWEIGAAEEGGRLENFVRRHLPHLSRRQATKAIDESAFLVNGRSATKGQRLKQGDRVVFHGAKHWLSELPVAAVRARVTVIYEDTEIIAIDKPAGIPTHGFSGRDVDTLANMIVAQWPELSSVGRSRWEPGLLNRLDTETSGLVLVAKNQPAYDNLREQFRGRRVTKKYIALVWGEVASSGSIGLALAHDPTDRRRMRVVDDFGTNRRPLRSWHALTSFRKLASSGEVSLVEITMETGVTHQIRVHLAAIGHAIVGDPLYGSKKDPTDLARHFLHSSCLQFAHPASGQRTILESPLPTELGNFLKRVKIVA